MAGDKIITFQIFLLPILLWFTVNIVNKFTFFFSKIGYYSVIFMVYRIFLSHFAQIFENALLKLGNLIKMK